MSMPCQPWSLTRSGLVNAPVSFFHWLKTPTSGNRRYPMSSMWYVVTPPGPASPSFNRRRRVMYRMVDTADAGTDEYDVPSMDEYQQETRVVREATLPDMGFTLPVTHAPPGQTMSSMEKYGLAGLFGGGGDFDADAAVTDDGEVTVNQFMENEILPHIVTEQTNKDAFHWDDDDIADDPDVDAFNVAALSAEDLGALVQEIMAGGDDLGEDELDRFQ